MVLLSLIAILCLLVSAITRRARWRWLVVLAVVLFCFLTPTAAEATYPPRVVLTPNFDGSVTVTELAPAFYSRGISADFVDPYALGFQPSFTVGRFNGHVQTFRPFVVDRFDPFIVRPRVVVDRFGRIILR